MVGNGDSYGVKGYLYQHWKRWSRQLSYAYSRSREWFGELPEKGKVPSLYDVPHQLGGALSYQLTTRSSFSVGGMLRSGKVRFLNEDYEPLSVDDFREKREPLNYRVDVRLLVPGNHSVRNCCCFVWACIMSWETLPKGIFEFLFRALERKLFAVRKHQLQILRKSCCGILCFLCAYSNEIAYFCSIY